MSERWTPPYPGLVWEIAEYAHSQGVEMSDAEATEILRVARRDVHAAHGSEFSKGWAERDLERVSHRIRVLVAAKREAS